MTKGTGVDNSETTIDLYATDCGGQSDFGLVEL
jgi:hypothetical protein